MSNPLQGKNIVLYILDKDNNSAKAIEFVRIMPDVHIQRVDQLPRDKIPEWLTSVPTCVVLKTKQVYSGTQALQYLNQRYTTIREQFQVQQQQQPQQRMMAPQQPLQQRMNIPSIDPMRQTPGGMPGMMQQQQMQGMTPPQQMPFPHGMPPPNSGMPSMAGMGKKPMQGMPSMGSGNIPSAHASDPQNMPGQGDVLDSSLRPASGTGNYGCSLDMAFQPMEEQQISDPRYTSSEKSVSDGDLQMYMRMHQTAPGPQQQ